MATLLHCGSRASRASFRHECSATAAVREPTYHARLVSPESVAAGS
jgi:hypothetical protein